eukprot:362889-Chlamydomonas_euryale.AAC.1
MAYALQFVSQLILLLALQLAAAMPKVVCQTAAVPATPARRGTAPPALLCCCGRASMLGSLPRGSDASWAQVLLHWLPVWQADGTRRRPFGIWVTGESVQKGCGGGAAHRVLNEAPKGAARRDCLKREGKEGLLARRPGGAA